MKKKRGLKDRGKRVVGRVVIVGGFATALCWIGTMVAIGACITGVAERFGRSPMKPPE